MQATLKLVIRGSMSADFREAVRPIKDSVMVPFCVPGSWVLCEPMFTSSSFSSSTTRLFWSGALRRWAFLTNALQKIIIWHDRAYQIARRVRRVDSARRLSFESLEHQMLVSRHRVYSTIHDDKNCRNRLSGSGTTCTLLSNCHLFRRAQPYWDAILQLSYRGCRKHNMADSLPRLESFAA